MATVWVVAVVVVVEDVIVDDAAGFHIVNLQIAESINISRQFVLFLEASHFQMQDFPFHNIDPQ